MLRFAFVPLAIVALRPSACAEPRRESAPTRQASAPALAEAPPPAPEAVAERLVLVIAVTPGKPGAPTERVTVVRRGEAFVLRAERSSGERGEATLGAEDLRALGDAVSALRGFRPQVAPGRADDFGEIEIRIDAAAAREAGMALDANVAASWEAPLLNEAPAEALISSLGRLAAERVPTVTLAYF